MVRESEDNGGNGSIPPTGLIEPLLRRKNTAFYLVPLTYGYLFYSYGTVTMPIVGEVSLIVPMILTLIPASYMFIEGEARRNVEAARREISPWLYFESAAILFVIVGAVAIVIAFVFFIDWENKFRLSVLGFLNLAYVIGFLMDKLYAHKFNKYYSKDAVGEAKDESERQEDTDNAEMEADAKTE
jgi:hypothetical protein